MRARSWTWFLIFSRLFTCLAVVVTSLCGCGAHYEMIPSASGLPSSVQVEADRERLALPDELRARLKKAIADPSCRVAEQERPNRQYMGQIVGDPHHNVQTRLVKETLAWITEVSRDSSPKRLEHRKKLLLPIPEASTNEAPISESPTPSLLGEDGKEYTKGFIFGATSGAVPFAPMTVNVGIEVKLLPKGTYWARVGRACGEIAIGTGQIILGCVGIGAGVGMSGTGGGAPAGIVVMAGSVPLLANGTVTAWHGIEDLVQLRREGEPPCEASPPAEQPKPPQQLMQTQPAAKPAPPPVAAQPKPTATNTQTPVKPKPQTTSPAVSERGPPVSTQTNPTTTVTKTFTNPPPGVSKTRNMHLAGKTHPKTGVPFDADGYPDFRAAGVVKKEVKIKFTGERRKDRIAANKAANYGKTPDGHTWHHHQDGTTMQLVPLKLHADTGHTGGFSGVK